MGESAPKPPALHWFGLDDVRKGVLHAIGDVVHSEEVRGEDAIAFTCAEVPEKYDRILWWDVQESCWREHIVRETRSGFDGMCKVVADSTMSELKLDFMEACRFENVAYSDVLKWFIPYTRFAAGSCAFGGVGSATGWFTRMSAYEVMRELEEMYGVEFYVELVVDEDAQRVAERKLSFAPELGEWRGKRLTRGKNLPNGRLHVRADEVITAMYGFGSSFGAYDEDGNATGGFTRRLTFGSVNGGVNYVADERARERYGRPRTDGSRQHNFGYAIFDATEKPERLYTQTHAALQERNSPRVSYEIEGDVDCTGEDVRLGDTVVVADVVDDAPYRCGMRVVGRIRTFGDFGQMRVRLGEITAGSRSAFAAYERRCATVASFADAMVKAGLREPEGGTLTDALSVTLTLRGAARADGSDIDLRYAFEVLEGDVYRYDIEVENRLDRPVFDVRVRFARSGLDETLVYVAAGASKLYTYQVSPAASDIAAGAFSCNAVVSCPERFAGTSQHYAACEASAASALPLTATPKPASTIPDDLTGDGTFANPYTIADLRRCWCASSNESTFEDAWVSGFIVGWADMDAGYRLSAASLRLAADGASASNIVLADAPTAVDVSQCAGVNLSTATRRRKAVRAALNLSDNPQMLGRKVYVQGDVLRYGGETGMKRTDEYRYCDESGYWHGWNTYLGQLMEDLKG